MTEIDASEELSSISESDFKFGKYVIRNDIELNLPENKIQFSKIDNNKFSYSRNHSGEVTKKTIHHKAENLRVQFAPILPIHLPSYKTDFVFLRFTDPIVISGNAVTELAIRFPIEIGMFLMEAHLDMLDCFTCKSRYSRFSLYGTPEDGRLCKYAKIPLFFDRGDQDHLAYANLKIKIKNELEKSASVGKIVIPASDHDLYYNNNSVMMDDLKITVKNRIGLEIVDIVQKQITKQEGWTLSPRSVKKTEYRFSMEWGFD
jgi:hypothetical protein